MIKADYRSRNMEMESSSLLRDLAGVPRPLDMASLRTSSECARADVCLHAKVQLISPFGQMHDPRPDLMDASLEAHAWQEWGTASMPVHLFHPTSLA